MLKIAQHAVIGAALVAASAAPALADVKAGVDAYQRGDYAAAINEWRPLADRGDADAQFNLAQAYKLGRGVPANLDTAIGLYRKAALQDHAEAGALLGLLLFQNGNRAEAMPWLSKAADRGDSASQYVYGTALFNGDMVKQDWPRAYSLMTQASAQGLPPARQALLEMDKYIPQPQREQGAALARTAANHSAPVSHVPLATASRTGPATPGVGPNVATPPVRLASNAGVTRQPPANPARPDTGLPARPNAPAKMATPASTMPPVKTPAKAPPPAKPAPAKPVAATKPVATKPVATKPATPVKAAVVPMRGAGWKIQLGAFKEAGAANSLFGSLKKRVGALSGAQPMLVKAGAVTRLQAGPFPTRAAAASACAAVTSAGQACFPVAP